MERRIEYMPLSSVVFANKNPKRHDIQRIVKSIERFGFVLPPALNESTGRLVSGHGRVEALRSMQSGGKQPPAGVKVLDDGSWAIPILRGADFATEQEADAYLLADNKLSEIGGWDSKELSEMFQTLENQALDDLGFMEREVRETFKKVQEATLDDVMKSVNTKKTVKKPCWVVVRLDRQDLPKIEEHIKAMRSAGVKVETSFDESA